MRRTFRTEKELRRLENMRAAKRARFIANAAEWKTVRIITDENVLNGRKTVIECFHDGGDHRFLRLKINGVPHRIRTAGQVDRSLRIMMAERLEKTDGK